MVVLNLFMCGGEGAFCDSVFGCVILSRENDIEGMSFAFLTG